MSPERPTIRINWGSDVIVTIGYSVRDAAEAAGVRVRDIEVAIHRRELACRNVEGQPVVLATDIQTWLEAQTAWSP